MIVKLNDGSCAEHSLLVHNQAAVMCRVNVTLYQQKVRARFYGQETRARYVNAKGFMEMLNGGPSCCFKLFEVSRLKAIEYLVEKPHLDDRFPVLHDLAIDDDV